MLVRERSDTDEILEKVIDLEYDRDAMDAYKEKRLREALHNAIENTEYYSQFRHLLVSESDPYVILKQIPTISKQDIVSNPGAFVNKKQKGVSIKNCTSGTSGIPITIHQDLRTVKIEQAFVSRYLRQAGYIKGDKRAWIRAELIVPLKSQTPPYWRYSYFENMMLMSSFHLSNQSIPLYLEALEKFGTQIIQATPSSIMALAKYLEANDAYYAGELKSIITSSEWLPPEMRHIVEERFRCKVFDWYGLSERVASAGMCEHGRYHINEDYSYVELEKVDDNRYEIIGTNFINHLYPILRYRTGDFVTITNQGPCQCGKVTLSFDYIEGRLCDYITDKLGNNVSSVAHISKGIHGLLATQIIQQSEDTIEAHVVVNEAFDSHQQELLIAKCKLKLGDSMKVIIKEVEKIPRTENGKVIQVISNM
ncbi:phenylacetate--CoA ligase family protein [Vibrio sp. WXL210]|uniref:phenylacetate--CoA ligase family protein n=1 Tax=Vibrio sp. WXL210 TaxID=3450709 RepID=UPI003EC78109